VWFDSSSKSRAAILLQRFEKGKDGKPETRLIDYFSRSIPLQDRWCGILRNEFLSMVTATEFWHRYFICPRHTIVFHTDSKALYSLCRNEARNPRIHAFLQNCKTIYRPVQFLWTKSENNIADIFSRCPDPTDLVEENRVHKPLQIFLLQHDKRALLDAHDKCPQAKAVVQSLFDMTLVDPAVNRSSHEEVKKTIRQVMTRSMATGLRCSKPLKGPRAKHGNASVTKSPTDVLNPDDPIFRPVGHTRDFRRSRMRDEINNRIISSRLPGSLAEVAHAKWHVPMRTLVDKFNVPKKKAMAIVADCPSCSNKPERNAHVRNIERGFWTPDGPFHEHSMDIKYMQHTVDGPGYIIGVFCMFSKFIRLASLRALDSRSVYNALCEIYRYTSFPKALRVDCDPAFTSAEFKGAMAGEGTIIIPNSPYRKNSSRIERSWRCLKDYIERTRVDWTSAKGMMDIHSYLNIMTGNSKYNGVDITPWEIELGHEPPIKAILNHGDEDNYRMQSQLVWSDFKTAMHKKQDSKRVSPRLVMFQVGEKVGFHRKGSLDKQILNGTVVSMDSDTVVIETGSGTLITRHRANVLKLSGSM